MQKRASWKKAYTSYQSLKSGRRQYRRRPALRLLGAGSSFKLSCFRSAAARYRRTDNSCLFQLSRDRIAMGLCISTAAML